MPFDPEQLAQMQAGTYGQPPPTTPDSGISMNSQSFVTMYGPQGYGTYLVTKDFFGNIVGTPEFQGGKEPSGGTNVQIMPADSTGAWSVQFDANGNGFRINKITGEVQPLNFDKSPGGTVGVPTNPQIMKAGGTPTGYVYQPTGQVVNWDGSPYNGPGYANGVATGGSGADKTAMVGGSLYEKDPATGQWKVAIQAAPSMSYSSGGGGGGSNSSSVHSGGYANTTTTTTIKDITPAAAAAEAANIAANAAADAQNIALKAGFDSVEAQKARDFAREMQDRADHFKNVELKQQLADQYATQVGAADPGSFARLLGAQGGNLQAGLNANPQGGFLSDASLAPAAKSLQAMRDLANGPGGTWNPLTGQTSGNGTDTGTPTTAPNNPWTGPALVPSPPQAVGQDGSVIDPTGALAQAAAAAAYVPPGGYSATSGPSYYDARGQKLSPSQVLTTATGGYIDSATGQSVEMRMSPKPLDVVPAMGGWGKTPYSDAATVDPRWKPPVRTNPLPGQIVPIDNGVGGGPIDLTKQATVPMLATGGMTRAPMMLVGDARARNPEAGGARPEMIMNPWGAPIQVLSHPQTEVMMGREMRGMPRYADGTQYGQDSGLTLATDPVKPVTQDPRYLGPPTYEQNAVTPAANPTPLPQPWAGGSGGVMDTSGGTIAAAPPPTPAPNPWLTLLPSVPNPQSATGGGTSAGSIAAGAVSPPMYSPPPGGVWNVQGQPGNVGNPPTTGGYQVPTDPSQAPANWRDFLFQTPGLDATGLTDADLWKVYQERMKARTYGWNPSDLYRFDWGRLDPVSQAARAAAYQTGWNIPTAYTAWAPGAYTPGGISRNRMTVAA